MKPPSLSPIEIDILTIRASLRKQNEKTGETGRALAALRRIEMAWRDRQGDLFCAEQPSTLSWKTGTPNVADIYIVTYQMPQQERMPIRTVGLAWYNLTAQGGQWGPCPWDLLSGQFIDEKSHPITHWISIPRPADE